MRAAAGPPYTASMRTVRPAVATLRKLGRDPAPLLERLGVDPSELEDDDLRLPERSVLDLWDGARELSGDDCFGLRALGAVRSDQRSIIDYVLLNSPDLGALIERGMRYERMWQDGRVSSLEVEGAEARMRWRARPGSRFSPSLIELGILAVVRLCRAATGTTGSGPRLVCFAHAPPRGPDAPVHAYEEALHAPVRFDAGEYAVHFAARDLATPIANADPALLAVLERHASQTLSSLPTGQSFGQRVREVLARELAGGRPTLVQVALHLRASPRTVRRRLQGEALTFHGLLDELRREVALRHLADPALSITEIAFLLGFADGAAFTKAFRRWTGRSPLQHRRGQ